MVLGRGKPVDTSKIVPRGTLLHLPLNLLRPSVNNPRRLFDPGPLESLKESIREHGVLVPLTVYKLPGQEMYAIVDGERRFRCCTELVEEGKDISIPANVVDPPDAMASLIYMFNIHQFREQWELMPTARALKTVAKAINSSDPNELHQVTGLSHPQVERCLRILSFPERFQEMSLEEDPAKRIPSNFWVELHPVLEKTAKVLPDLVSELGRDGITDKLVEKYRARRIKSVIHFRRILEAFDVVQSSADERLVANRLREYVLDRELETRRAFDMFITDNRRVNRAAEAADWFMREVERAKIDHAVDGKDELIEKLRGVLKFVQNLIIELEGGDAPPEDDEDEDDS